jgi:hypothetical protein
VPFGAKRSEHTNPFGFPSGAAFAQHHSFAFMRNVSRKEQARCVAMLIRAMIEINGVNTGVVPGRQRTRDYWIRKRMVHPGQPDAWKIGVQVLRNAGLVETVPSSETRFVTGMSLETAKNLLVRWLRSQDDKTPNKESSDEEEEEEEAPPVCRARRRKQTGPRRAPFV